MTIATRLPLLFAVCLLPVGQSQQLLCLCPSGQYASVCNLGTAWVPSCSNCSKCSDLAAFTLGCGSTAGAGLELLDATCAPRAPLNITPGYEGVRLYGAGTKSVVSISRGLAARALTGWPTGFGDPASSNSLAKRASLQFLMRFGSLKWDAGGGGSAGADVRLASPNGSVNGTTWSAYVSWDTDDVSGRSLELTVLPVSTGQGSTGSSGSSSTAGTSTFSPPWRTLYGSLQLSTATGDVAFTSTKALRPGNFRGAGAGSEIPVWLENNVTGPVCYANPVRAPPALGQPQAGPWLTSMKTSYGLDRTPDGLVLKEGNRTAWAQPFRLPVNMLPSGGNASSDSSSSGGGVGPGITHLTALSIPLARIPVELGNWGRGYTTRLQLIYELWANGLPNGDYAAAAGNSSVGGSTAFPVEMYATSGRLSTLSQTLVAAPPVVGGTVSADPAVGPTLLYRFVDEVPNLAVDAVTGPAGSVAPGRQALSMDMASVEANNSWLASLPLVPPMPIEPPPGPNGTAMTATERANWVVTVGGVPIRPLGQNFTLVVRWYAPQGYIYGDAANDLVGPAVGLRLAQSSVVDANGGADFGLTLGSALGWDRLRNNGAGGWTSLATEAGSYGKAYLPLGYHTCSIVGSSTTSTTVTTAANNATAGANGSTGGASNSTGGASNSTAAMPAGGFMGTWGNFSFGNWSTGDHAPGLLVFNGRKYFPNGTLEFVPLGKNLSNAAWSGAPVPSDLAGLLTPDGLPINPQTPTPYTLVLLDGYTPSTYISWRRVYGTAPIPDATNNFSVPDVIVDNPEITIAVIDETPADLRAYWKNELRYDNVLNTANGPVTTNTAWDNMTLLELDVAPVGGISTQGPLNPGTHVLVRPGNDNPDGNVDPSGLQWVVQNVPLPRLWGPRGLLTGTPLAGRAYVEVSFRLAVTTEQYAAGAVYIDPMRSRFTIRVCAAIGAADGPCPPSAFPDRLSAFGDQGMSGPATPFSLTMVDGFWPIIQAPYFLRTRPAGSVLAPMTSTRLPFQPADVNYPEFKAKLFWPPYAINSGATATGSSGSSGSGTTVTSVFEVITYGVPYLKSFMDDRPHRLWTMTVTPYPSSNSVYEDNRAWNYFDTNINATALLSRPYVDLIIQFAPSASAPADEPALTYAGPDGADSWRVEGVANGYQWWNTSRHAHLHVYAPWTPYNTLGTPIGISQRYDPWSNDNYIGFSLESTGATATAEWTMNPLVISLTDMVASGDVATGASFYGDSLPTPLWASGPNDPALDKLPMSRLILSGYALRLQRFTSVQFTAYEWSGNVRVPVEEIIGDWDPMLFNPVAGAMSSTTVMNANVHAGSASVRVTVVYNQSYNLASGSQLCSIGYGQWMDVHFAPGQMVADLPVHVHPNPWNGAVLQGADLALPYVVCNLELSQAAGVYTGTRANRNIRGGLHWHRRRMSIVLCNDMAVNCPTSADLGFSPDQPEDWASSYGKDAVDLKPATSVSVLPLTGTASSYVDRLVARPGPQGLLSAATATAGNGTSSSSSSTGASTDPAAWTLNIPVIRRAYSNVSSIWLKNAEPASATYKVRVMLPNSLTPNAYGSSYMDPNNALAERLLGEDYEATLVWGPGDYTESAYMSAVGATASPSPSVSITPTASPSSSPSATMGTLPSVSPMGYTGQVVLDEAIAPAYGLPWQLARDPRVRNLTITFRRGDPLTLLNVPALTISLVPIVAIGVTGFTGLLNPSPGEQFRITLCRTSDPSVVDWTMQAFCAAPPTVLAPGSGFAVMSLPKVGFKQREVIFELGDPFSPSPSVTPSSAPASPKASVSGVRRLDQGSGSAQGPTASGSAQGPTASGSWMATGGGSSLDSHWRPATGTRTWRRRMQSTGVTSGGGATAPDSECFWYGAVWTCIPAVEVLLDGLPAYPANWPTTDLWEPFMRIIANLDPGKDANGQPLPLEQVYPPTSYGGTIMQPHEAYLNKAVTWYDIDPSRSGTALSGVTPGWPKGYGLPLYFNFGPDPFSFYDMFMGPVGYGSTDGSSSGSSGGGTASSYSPVPSSGSSSSPVPSAGSSSTAGNGNSTTAIGPPPGWPFPANFTRLVFNFTLDPTALNGFATVDPAHATVSIVYQRTLAQQPWMTAQPSMSPVPSFNLTVNATANLTLPNVTMPDLNVTANLTLPNVTMPDLNVTANLTLPNVTMPDLNVTANLTLPNVTMPDLNVTANLTLPNVTVPSLNVTTNVTLPNVTMPGLNATASPNVTVPALNVTASPNATLPNVTVPSLNVTASPTATLPNVTVPSLNVTASPNATLPSPSTLPSRSPVPSPMLIPSPSPAVIPAINPPSITRLMSSIELRTTVTVQGKGSLTGDGGIGPFPLALPAALQTWYKSQLQPLTSSSVPSDTGSQWYWDELSLAQALIDWAQLPSGGPNGGTPPTGLPMLNLATGWSVANTSIAALLLPLVPGVQSSNWLNGGKGWAYVNSPVWNTYVASSLGINNGNNNRGSNSGNTTGGGVRRLQQEPSFARSLAGTGGSSNSSGGNNGGSGSGGGGDGGTQPFAAGILATRLQLHEATVLMADVWALPRSSPPSSSGSSGSNTTTTGAGSWAWVSDGMRWDSTTNSLIPGFSRYGGYNNTGGGPRAVQRAIPTGVSALFIPDGTGDSRSVLRTVSTVTGRDMSVSGGNRSADMLTYSNPYSGSLSVSGVDVTVTTVTWTLRGVPSPWLQGVYTAAGVAPTHGTSTGTGPGFPAPHTLTLTTNGLTAVVPPGRLLPGYFYSVQAAVSGTTGLRTGPALSFPSSFSQLAASLRGSAGVNATTTNSSSSGGPGARLLAGLQRLLQTSPSSTASPSTSGRTVTPTPATTATGTAAASAAARVSGLGAAIGSDGLTGAQYLLSPVVATERVSFTAAAIQQAAAYVHAPPLAAIATMATGSSALAVSPPNGTALLTQFQLNTTGWTNDVDARSTEAVPPIPALTTHLTTTPMATTWQFSWVAVGQGLADARTAVGIATGVSDPCAAAKASAALGTAPAWYTRQGLLGTSLGQSADLTCATIHAATEAAMRRLAVNSSVLPLNYRGSSAASGFGGGNASLAVSAGTSLTYSFRVDLTGAATNASDTPALTRLQLGNPLFYASSSSDLGLYPTAWSGSPLTALTAVPGIRTTLPLPTGAAATLYTYVRDEEGAVAVAASRVPLVLNVPPPAAAGATTEQAVAAAAATTSFVSDVTKTLTTDSVTANPFGALLTANSLGNILSNASASSIGIPGGSIGNNSAANNATANQIEELRKNNTALRTALVDTVATAVASIANTSSSSIGSGALAGLGLTVSITISIGSSSGSGTGGGSSGSPIAATGVSNLTSSALDALKADTSIALDGGTAVAAANALAGLTSDPTELSNTAGVTALSSLQTVLALSLPTNVLLGVADDGLDVSPDSGSSSGSGGSGSGSDTNSTVTTPQVAPPDPALISAGAAVTLNVLSTSLVDFTGGDGSGIEQVDEGTVTDTGNGTVASNVTATENVNSTSTANSVRRQAQTALTLLGSTMMRDAVPGAAPRSVSAGPSNAFKAAVNARRRLQGQAEIPADSFCGRALVLTTARLSSNASAAGSHTVPVSDAFYPCLSDPTSDAARQAETRAPVPAAVEMPSTVVSSSSAALGSNVRLVDLQVVQMSSTFGLPETSGFGGFRFAPPSASNAGSSSSGTGTARPLLGGITEEVEPLPGSMASVGVSKSGFGAFGRVGILARGLGARGLSVVANALGLDDTPTSAQAAIAAAGLSTTTKTSTEDLRPSSGLDSRVLAVNLQTRSGRAVPVEDAPAPIYLTIPLKDFSLPGSNKAAVTASNNAASQQSYTFTCPLAGEQMTLDKGMRLAALMTNGTNGSGQQLVQYASYVTVADIRRITYLAAQSDLPRQPSTCKLPFTSCDSSGQPTTSYSLSNAAQQATDAATDAATGGVTKTTQPVFVLTMPCAGLAGPRNVTCGPGSYGNTTTFECPDIVARPVCAFWSESLGRWSSQGCSVYNVSDDAVTCACTHLTEFAARFAALAADNRDIFAQTTNLGAADYHKAMLMLGIIGTILAILVASVLLTHYNDNVGDARFYATLIADEEVQFLAKIETLKGHEFILDRKLDRVLKAKREQEMAVAKALAAGLPPPMPWYLRLATRLRVAVCGRNRKVLTPAGKGAQSSAAAHAEAQGGFAGAQISSAGLDAAAVVSNPYMSQLSAAEAKQAKGRKLTFEEEQALRINEAQRRARIEAKHKNLQDQGFGNGAGGSEGTGAGGTAAGAPGGGGMVAGDAGMAAAAAAGSVAAELAAEDIATNRRGGYDPYTAALYMRLVETFDMYRVTPDRLQSGVVKAVVDSEVADAVTAPTLPEMALQSILGMPLSLVDKGTELAQHAAKAVVTTAGAAVHTAEAIADVLMTGPNGQPVMRPGSVAATAALQQQQAGGPGGLAVDPTAVGSHHGVLANTPGNRAGYMPRLSAKIGHGRFGVGITTTTASRPGDTTAESSPTLSVQGVMSAQQLMLPGAVDTPRTVASDGGARGISPPGLPTGADNVDSRAPTLATAGQMVTSTGIPVDMVQHHDPDGLSPVVLEDPLGHKERQPSMVVPFSPMQIMSGSQALNPLAVDGRGTPVPGQGQGQHGQAIPGGLTYAGLDLKGVDVMHGLDDGQHSPSAAAIPVGGLPPTWSASGQDPLSPSKGSGDTPHDHPLEGHSGAVAMAQKLKKMSAGEYYKMNLIAKAKRKMEVLDDTSRWSFVRAWKLRNFMAKVWLLRLWYTHTYFSIFTRYDPRSPRTSRLLLLGAVLLGNMFVTAFFYAFRSGRPGQDLPPLTVSETIVVSILSAVIQQPVEIILKKCIEWAGQSEFTHRYPYIWSELKRRKAAETRLAGMSREALAAELAMANKEHRGEALALASSLMQKGSLSGGGGVDGRAPGGPGANGHQVLGRFRPTGGNGGYLANAAANGLIAPTVVTVVANGAGTGADGASSATSDGQKDQSNGGNTSPRDSEGGFDYGWVDPPTDCVAYCSCLVRVCGRHPSQKAAYVAARSAEERAKIETHRRKILMAQARARAKEDAAREATRKRKEVATAARQERRAARKAARQGSVAASLEANRNSGALGTAGAGAPLPTSGGLLAIAGTAALQAELEQHLHDAHDVTDGQLSPAASEALVPPGAGTGVLATGGVGPGFGSAFSDADDDDDQGDGDDGDDKDDGGEREEFDVEGDLEGFLTAQDSGDCAAVLCNAMCVFWAARLACLGRRSAQKQARISMTKSGRYLTRTISGRAVISKELPKAMAVAAADGAAGGPRKPKTLAQIKAEEAAADAAGAKRGSSGKGKAGANAPPQQDEVETAEAEDAAHVAEIAETATGYLRAACGILPCTSATTIAYAVCCGWIAFCLFYILLFGLYQPAQATTDFVTAFFVSQGFSLFVVQPMMLLASIVAQLAVFPAWAPYLLWIPKIGPIIAGNAAKSVSAQDGSTALTGRLENLTLVRAAGAASSLPPDSALIAYGTTAVLGAAMGSAGRAVQRMAAEAARQAKDRKEADAKRKAAKAKARASKASRAAGGDGFGQDSTEDDAAVMSENEEAVSALASLTEAERHELIVRRYLIAQLKAAEAARRRQMNKRTAKESVKLAYAANQAVRAFQDGRGPGGAGGAMSPRLGQAQANAGAALTSQRLAAAARAGQAETAGDGGNGQGAAQAAAGAGVQASASPGAETPAQPRVSASAAAAAILAARRSATPTPTRVGVGVAARSPGAGARRGSVTSSVLIDSNLRRASLTGAGVAPVMAMLESAPGTTQATTADGAGAPTAASGAVAGPAQPASPSSVYRDL